MNKLAMAALVLLSGTFVLANDPVSAQKSGLTNATADKADDEVEAHYTDWTPIATRWAQFAEEIDESDPWQFENVLAT
jgi:hypothetical protein